MPLNRSQRTAPFHALRRPLAVACQLVALTLLLVASPWATPASACVGPPPEPVCTKTLHLAIAGPPVILLPGGGSFDVPALVFFGLSEFPMDSGTCPAGPYAVDIDITATCTPGGADGSGSIIAAPMTTGYNEFVVSVDVPAGPPRQCTLSAVATVTLADGMVLSDRADNVACLGDPSASNPSRPRIGLRLVSPPGSEISRLHPGDPVNLRYALTNNDPNESFSGTLTMDSVNESRQPEFSGPMPPGTAVVSVSDPVQGDNFPIDLAIQSGDLAEGPPSGPLCLELPEDPANPDIPIEVQEIALGPGEVIVVNASSRPWGMCSDGSCGRSTLVLEGDFSDATSGIACSGFVSAADASVAPADDCPDSGSIVRLPPPPGPRELLTRISPLPDLEVEIETELQQIFLTEDDVPVAPPLPFADRFSDQKGRIQSQFIGPFSVDSSFNLILDITYLASLNNPDVTVDVLRMIAEGAPVGFEATAPFASPLLRLDNLPGQTEPAFFTPIVQFNAVGIDNLGNRRPIAFGNISFQLFPGGLRAELTDGEVTAGGGNTLDAFELAIDVSGFGSRAVQGSTIFTDGFEFGNISRWSDGTIAGR